MNIKTVIEEGGRVSKSLLSLYAIVVLLLGGVVATYTFAQTVIERWDSFESSVSEMRTDFTESFNEVRIQIDRLETQVKIASAPLVAEYSAATRVAGPCQVGEECLMIIRLRRHKGAESCEILANRTRYFLVSYADFFERTMDRVDPTIRNVGTDFETLELRLRVPESTPAGPAEIRISAQYTNCEWQTNGVPPVIQTSPAFPLVVTLRE